MCCVLHKSFYFFITYYMTAKSHLQAIYAETQKCPKGSTMLWNKTCQFFKFFFKCAAPAAPIPQQQMAENILNTIYKAIPASSHSGFRKGITLFILLSCDLAASS